MNSKEISTLRAIEPNIEKILADFNSVIQKYGIEDVSVKGFQFDLKELKSEVECRWVCEKQDDGTIFCGLKCSF